MSWPPGNAGSCQVMMIDPPPVSTNQSFEHGPDAVPDGTGHSRAGVHTETDLKHAGGEKPANAGRHITRHDDGHR